MKKITLLFILTTICSFSQNLISNGALDDATGWTIVNHYGAENTNGSVTISGGVATFNEATAGPDDWKHMGLYTSVVLSAGTYQFDMNMAYTSIEDAWGEVYIGLTEPVQHSDYVGDQQILKAYNAWDCSSIKTYNGLAASSGCSGEAVPGQFEITTAGTYYVLFRTGGNTYGVSGVVIDNLSIISSETAGIDDIDSNDLKVYPNPTNTSWNFSNGAVSIETVVLSNAFGKTLLELQPESSSFSIDADGLVPGVYIIAISTDQGAYSRKLIKK